jgi:hypothetical protein
MRTERKRAIAAGAVLATALAGAGAVGVVADAQVKVPTVTVTLKEYKIASAAKLKAGKVTLAVVNKGKIPHALEIAGPGLRKKTAMLAPGKTAKLTVSLKDGSYSLWCPVANHAALGMKLTAKIGSVAAAGGGTTAPTTGGGATGGTGATGGAGDGSTAGGEWG